MYWGITYFIYTSVNFSALDVGLGLQFFISSDWTNIVDPNIFKGLNKYAKDEILDLFS